MTGAVPGRSAVDPSGPQPGTGADDLLALVNHLGLDRVHLVEQPRAGLSLWISRSRFFNDCEASSSRTALEACRTTSTRAGATIEAPQFAALPPDVRELGPSCGPPMAGAARWLELEKISRPEGTPPPVQTFRNRLTFSLLETIAVPTLLMTGDADLYSPPAVLLFAARIRNSESVIVPEVGHSTYWEQPGSSIRRSGFIRRH